MSYRRNMVIVAAHGLRADAVGDSQTWPLATPELERLGSRGLRAIASSASPADWGGMLSLLTGAHARQHGYLDQTHGHLACAGWPALLRDAGYHLAGVGLVGGIEASLQESVLVEGVDQVDAPRCRYLAAMQEKGLRPVIEGQRRQRRRAGPFEPDRLLLEPHEDIDGFILAHARRLLDTMPSDRPWALIVIFSGPGNDLPPPVLYESMVDRRELALGFIPPDLKAVDALAELDYPRVMLQRLEPHNMANIRADYLGRVAMIDHGVGELNNAVQERPDRERTWVVVASDRGQLLGEHGLVGHRSFLCGAVEVPVIISAPVPVPGAVPGPREGAGAQAYASEGLADLPPRGTPGVAPGFRPVDRADDAPGTPGTPGFARFHDGLASTVDVAATIAALGGCDLPPACIGRSLLPALGDDAVLRPLAGGCLSEFGKRLMLETERYKVTFNTETLQAMGLFDLLNDPEEKQNLVESPIGVNLLDALRWRLGEALLPLRALPGGVGG